MKRILFLVCVSFFGITTYAQSPAQSQSGKPGIYLPDGSKMDEYKKTFEIKDNPNPDKETLSKIEVSKYWKLIQLSQRTEVLDAATGLTLILYSQQEMKLTFSSDTLLFVVPGNDNLHYENKKAE